MGVCRTLLGINLDIRRVPGTALVNEATGQVVYTPPAGETLLRKLLAHPFTDGNGRTGRILNLLFLVEQDLLELPVLYLSRAIIHRKSDYYGLLLAVTTHAVWEDWILYMLRAVDETARWTTERIRAIRQLMLDTAEYVRQEAKGVYSRELVELLFVQPAR